MKAIFAVGAFFFSTAVFAACYLIYSPANELVWRGTSPPVDMDTASLNAAVQKIVPQGHLVVSNDDKAPCSALNLTTPRKTMRQKAREMKGD
jgi:hypothetical protein